MGGDDLAHPAGLNATAMLAYAVIPAATRAWANPDALVETVGGHPLLAHAIAFGKRVPVARVLVCGSLYLAGEVLKLDAA